MTKLLREKLELRMIRVKEGRKHKLLICLIGGKKAIDLAEKLWKDAQ